MTVPLRTADGPASAPKVWATKADAAYEIVRGQVLAGTLPPGGIIEQEVLARQLGLSTTPLREALRRLEAEGLLHQVAHREMRVPQLTAKELDELYTVRIQVDPYAAKLGAQRATDADRHMVLNLREAPSGATTAEAVAWHRKLHRVMYTAAGNTVLTSLLDGLWDRTDRYRAILIGELGQSGQEVSGHLDTVDAFVAGDGTSVAKLLRRDLMASRDALAQILADGVRDGSHPAEQL